MAERLATCQDARDPICSFGAGGPEFADSINTSLRCQVSPGFGRRWRSPASKLPLRNSGSSAGGSRRERITPRSARRRPTTRKLKLNVWYSQTAWLMTSPGKRWQRYRSGVRSIFQPDPAASLRPVAVTVTMPATAKPHGRAGPDDITKARLIAEAAKKVSQRGRSRFACYRVSIHAPALRATFDLCGEVHAEEFRSTPQYQGRLGRQLPLKQPQVFRSTPPRAGATLDQGRKKSAQTVSIYTTRLEPIGSIKYYLPSDTGST